MKTHCEALKTKEYMAWRFMKQRCNDPNKDNFKYYGGRGITVCERWQNSYENFLADVGRAPSKKHSLDRIDSNGHYEPNNVHWATAIEQMRNRSCSHWIDTPNGKMTINEVSRATGIKRTTIRNRVFSGCSYEQLVRPVRTRSL